MDANLIAATGLVDRLREATQGSERCIRADGRPLTRDMMLNLLETAFRDWSDADETMLFWLHPAQWRLVQENLSGSWVPWDQMRDGPDHHEIHGVPVVQSQQLPKAVVYLLDPNAVTLGGNVLLPERVYRLTGLEHPETDR